MTRQKTWNYPTIGYDEQYFRSGPGWDINEPSCACTRIASKLFSSFVFLPPGFRFERPAKITAPTSVGWHLNRFSLPELTLLKELSMSETTPVPVKRLRDPESWSTEVANYPGSDVISGVSRGDNWESLPWFIKANPDKYPHFFAPWWERLASKYK